MKFGLIGLCLLSLSAVAANLPVDDEIAILRNKADYLEKMKTLLEKNDCRITIGTNTVALVAGALRSEGMVIAVGPGFPNNYLAFHKAPKPEFMKGVIENALLKGGAGKNANILSGQLYSKDDTDYTHFVVYVNEPMFVKGTDSLWMYNKTNVALKLNGLELNGTHSGKSPNGTPVTLECKPR